MPEFLDELRDLQRQAADVRATFAGLRAAVPERAEGTDRTGVVRVLVGGQGLPERIWVTPDWLDLVAESGFEQAVRDAYTDATGALMASWSHAVESGQAGPAPVSAPPPVATTPVISDPRPFREVLADALRNDPGPDLPETASHGNGRDRSGHLALTLTSGAIVTCSAPSQWLSGQPAEDLNTALAEALDAARNALGTVLTWAAPTTRPGDRLLGEIQAWMRRIASEGVTAL